MKNVTAIGLSVIVTLFVFGAYFIGFSDGKKEGAKIEHSKNQPPFPTAHKLVWDGCTICDEYPCPEEPYQIHVEFLDDDKYKIITVINGGCIFTVEDKDDAIKVYADCEPGKEEEE